MTETKRCKVLRGITAFLYVVCGYLLSTTFAVAPVEYKGEEVLSYMTAINLAFGGLGGEVPVYTNKIAIIFFVIPLVGFFFMFFDKKSNIKNIVSLVGSVLGCAMISFLIGGYIGIGGLLSVLLYFVIAVMSAFGIVLHLADGQKTRQTVRLSPHE